MYNIQTFTRTPGDVRRTTQEHKTVRLVSRDGRYPVASPRLLKLHAAVANVCHASGMAGIFDSYLRKRDQIGCLAADGSTGITDLLRVGSTCC